MKTWQKIAAIQAANHTIGFLRDYPDDEEGPSMLQEAAEGLRKLKEAGWTGAAAELEQHLQETKDQCEAARGKDGTT